jgi:hypothetical protein
LEGPRTKRTNQHSKAIPLFATSAVGPASSVTRGVGLGQSASPPVGGQTSLRLIRSFATKHPLAPSGLTCRPRLLPMPTSGQSVAETLKARRAGGWLPCNPAPEAQLNSAHEFLPLCQHGRPPRRPLECTGQTGSNNVRKSINNRRSSSQHLSSLWSGHLQTTSLVC